MSLWLGDLFDMEEHRGMGLPNGAKTGFKDLAHPGVIPGLDLVDVDAIGAIFFLKTFQHFGDGSFCRLVLAGDRNAIAIIPNEDSQGYLQDACGIKRFPEMPLAGRSVADGAEANLVAVVREIGKGLQRFYIP